MKRLLELGQRKFVRDTLSLQTSSFVQAGTYLATSVLIARHLGETNLGRWAAAREIFSLAFVLLSAGLLQITVSRYSAALGRGDRDDATSALAALVKLSAIYSALVLVVGVLAAPAFGAAFYDDREVGLIAAVLCVTAFFESVKTLTYAVLQGSRQMNAYARLDVILAVLRVGIIGAAVGLDGGITGVMWAFVAHGVVVTWMALRAYRQAATGSHEKLRPPPLREVLAAAPRASVRDLFGQARILAALKAINTFVPRLGMILIPMAGVTLDGSFAAGGAFSVAFFVSWGLGLLCSGITNTLLPALGMKMGRSDVPFATQGPTLMRVSLVSGGLMTAMVAASAALMPWIVRVFYGAGYEAAAEFYLWIALGHVFTGFAVIVEPFFIYARRLSVALRLNLVLALVMLAMIVSGARLGGPMGVAMASGLSRAVLVIHLVYIWRYFRRASTGSAAPPR